MNLEDIRGFSLMNLARKNIILGKNGCGKSYLLKQVEQHIRGRQNIGKVRYISPERGGNLFYESTVEQNLRHASTWMDDTRRRNQAENFRQQSVSLYTRLEMLTLREIEREHTQVGYQPKNFQNTIDKINTLLDRVRLERSENGFILIVKDTGQSTSAELLSSGEAELVSLAIEFLSFSKECDLTRQNFLFIDEPDVHLHPDLQDKLAQFISTEISASHLTIVIASHSTSFVGALARDGNANIAFMKKGDIKLDFREINEMQKQILPMFGAHPLSNVFNEAPILIVEGEDDERIWQQAVRSSVGRIRFYPCVAHSIDQMNAYETQADNIIGAVYDNAKGFSLRDRDGASEEIDNIGSIVRMRLSCRAAENLLLSDDVLRFAGTDWNGLLVDVQNFVLESTHHRYHERMREFLDSGANRKDFDLKEIRMVLAGLVTNKPWEVLVGQTIAHILQNPGIDGDNSLKSYLGPKVCTELLRLAN